MNEWILLVIGLFIGSTLGDLRTQRKLLKEELLKKQPSKPKPRKYRKKNVGSK